MKLTHAYNENNLRTVEVVYAVVPEDTSEKKSGKFDNYEF